MSSDLSRIPVDRRRHAAALLGLFAAFLVTVGVLPWVAATTTGIRVFAAVTLLVGVLLALVAWGLLQSTVLDRRQRAEAELDSVILDTAQAAGAGCGCGHEHDPDELHFTDEAPCSPESAACAHTCESCVLNALRS